jgi:hypothetical protein
VCWHQARECRKVPTNGVPLRPTSVILVASRRGVRTRRLSTAQSDRTALLPPR